MKSNTPPVVTRHYCWHCGERVIGRLTTWTTRPHCSACPSWQAGCTADTCEHCLTPHEIRQLAKPAPKERRKRVSSRGIAP